MNPSYRYDCEVVKIVDGDTIDCIVDLGFYMKTSMRFRLEGLDTPEIRSKNKKEKLMGQAASKYVKDFFGTLPCKASIITTKGDKYGRYLATLYKGAACLNQLLLDNKIAKKYDGGHKPKWP